MRVQVAGSDTGVRVRKKEFSRSREAEGKNSGEKNARVEGAPSKIPARKMRAVG